MASIDDILHGHSVFWQDGVGRIAVRVQGYYHWYIGDTQGAWQLSGTTDHLPDNVSRHQNTSNTEKGTK